MALLSAEECFQRVTGKAQARGVKVLAGKYYDDSD
jgi:hypothetical protein